MNYIEKACKELGKTIENYLIDTMVNYVITENAKPILYNDGAPMVFGDKDDAMYCIELYDKEKESNFNVITEWEYLVFYDNDTLVYCLRYLIRKYGEYDGVSTIFFLKDMDDVVRMDNERMDALNIGIGVDNEVTILFSNENDTKQFFSNPYVLNNEVLYKIVEQLCQCGTIIETESVETKKENTMEETINKIKEISAIADVESQVLKILNNIAEKRLEGKDEYCCKEIVEISEKLFKVFEK